MSDIVERLRKGVDTNEPPDKTDAVMWDAATEIEQLRAERDALFTINERLRDEGDVLQGIAEGRGAEIGRLRAALESLNAHDGGGKRMKFSLATWIRLARPKT